MPAAAVIPAPLAYTKVVAVKTLLVGYQPSGTWPGRVTAARQAGFRRPFGFFRSAGLPISLVWAGVL